MFAKIFSTLALFFFTATVAYDKVRLEVYYEALCPGKYEQINYFYVSA